METESWQTALENWRERRRQTSKSQSSNLQKIEEQNRLEEEERLNRVRDKLRQIKQQRNLLNNPSPPPPNTRSPLSNQNDDILEVVSPVEMDIQNESGFKVMNSAHNREKGQANFGLQLASRDENDGHPLYVKEMYQESPNAAHFPLYSTPTITENSEFTIQDIPIDVRIKSNIEQKLELVELQEEEHIWENNLLQVDRVEEHQCSSAGQVIDALCLPDVEENILKMPQTPFFPIFCSPATEESSKIVLCNISTDSSIVPNIGQKLNLDKFNEDELLIEKALFSAYGIEEQQCEELILEVKNPKNRLHLQTPMPKTPNISADYDYNHTVHSLSQSIANSDLDKIDNIGETINETLSEIVTKAKDSFGLLPVEINDIEICSISSITDAYSQVNSDVDSSEESSKRVTRLSCTSRQDNDNAGSRSCKDSHVLLPSPPSLHDSSAVSNSSSPLFEIPLPDGICEENTQIFQSYKKAPSLLNMETCRQFREVSKSPSGSSINDLVKMETSESFSHPPSSIPPINLVWPSTEPVKSGSDKSSPHTSQDPARHQPNQKSSTESMCISDYGYAKSTYVNSLSSEVCQTNQMGPTIIEYILQPTILQKTNPFDSLQSHNDTIKKPIIKSKVFNLDIKRYSTIVDDQFKETTCEKLEQLHKARSNTPIKEDENLPPPIPPRLNVISTWYNCAGCNSQLGNSDLMIIEKLSLFYHLTCFVCARCGIQMSDGQSETAVRIRQGLIYCQICYHSTCKTSNAKVRRKLIRRSSETKGSPREITTPVPNEFHQIENQKTNKAWCN